MTSDELDKRLKLYYGSARFEQSPARYGTADCPPAWRFVDARIHSWTSAEREHLESGCRFCEKTQRMLAAAEPPTLGRLVEFVAGVLPDRKAMELYLDENPTYARLRDSTIIKGLARILREMAGL